MSALQLLAQTVGVVSWISFFNRKLSNMDQEVLERQRAKTLKEDGFNAWINKIYQHVHKSKGYDQEDNSDRSNN